MEIFVLNATRQYAAVPLRRRSNATTTIVINRSITLVVRTIRPNCNSWSRIRRMWNGFVMDAPISTERARRISSFDFDLFFSWVFISCSIFYIVQKGAKQIMWVFGYNLKSNKNPLFTDTLSCQLLETVHFATNARVFKLCGMFLWWFNWSLFAGLFVLM